LDCLASTNPIPQHTGVRHDSEGETVMIPTPALLIILIIVIALIALSFYGCIQTARYFYLTYRLDKITDMMHYLFDCGETADEYIDLYMEYIKISKKLADLKATSLLSFGDEEEN